MSGFHTNFERLMRLDLLPRPSGERVAAKRPGEGSHIDKQKGGALTPPSSLLQAEAYFSASVITVV